MAKKVEVYRLDYEMTDNKDQTTWTAYIAAYSSQEATDYLYGLLRNRKIVINSLSTECRLDAVTDEVRKAIAQPMLGKQQKTEKTEQKQTQKRSIVPKGE